MKLAKPVLSGRLINLRPIVAADAPAMFASLADHDALKLTGTHGRYTLAQVEAFCARVQAAEDRLDYAITLKFDPAYIGEAVLNEIDWGNLGANFRIALASSDYYGQGYGTEATRLLVDHGFRQLGLHRIELEVYDFNARAQRVYEKVGFVREGVRRDALRWEGQYHDAIIMSILAPDYLGRAGNHASPG